MIEFLQHSNAGPSAMQDRLPDGSARFGLHHVALWVDDVDAEAERLAGAGFPLAQSLVIMEGPVFASADTSADYGHMPELLSPLPALADFPAMVADAARGGQGGNLLTTTSMTWDKT